MKGAIISGASGIVGISLANYLLTKGFDSVNIK